MNRWVAMGCVLLAAGRGRAALVTTEQSGISQVQIGGVTVVESTDAKTDGFVSVFALWGSQTTPEARTAARSGAHEMAANARIDDKFRFSNTDFSTVLSQSSYAIHLTEDNIFVNRAVVDFVLPPSYLEVKSFVELPFVTLETVLLADLRVCFSAACSSLDSIFSFQANLDASYNNFNWSAQVHGDPGLDLTPLQNPAVTDDGGGQANGFFRTVNVGFPLFHGHLDLGTVPVGVPLTLEYVMQVRARGRGAANVGIAAINDPFLLDTDPVQQFDTLTVALAPAPTSDVPEPGSWLLCLSSLAALASFRRAPARR